MHSQALLFRYVELNTFGIEVLLEGENIIVVVRQPHKMPLEKVLPITVVTRQKAGVNLDTTF